MKKLLLAACVLAPILSMGQKIENLRATTQGDKIIITFDVTSSYGGDKFNISVYGSQDNFSAPLQQVNGDVGREQPGGKGKTIEFSAKSALGEYKGELLFEVRAEVIAAFALKSETVTAKRGKTTQLEWRGGAKNKDVKIELFRNGVSQGVLGTVSNSGSYQWSVPTTEKTGSGFQLQLANGSETVTSTPFAIKHKVPTLVKVLPVLVVGGVIAALSGGSKKSETDSSTLIAPPDLVLD